MADTVIDKDTSFDVIADAMAESAKAESIASSEAETNLDENLLTDEFFDSPDLEKAKLSESHLTKALNEAAASIESEKANFGIDADMLVGAPAKEHSKLTPGKLKFTYLEGSALPPDKEGNVVFADKTFDNLDTLSLRNLNNIVKSYYTGDKEDVSLYGVYKIEGIYNYHPFHLVVTHDYVHDNRDVLQGFLDDFEKACASGKGSEFLSDPKLQFGFYDNANLLFEPKNLLDCITVQAKLDMVEAKANEPMAFMSELSDADSKVPNEAASTSNSDTKDLALEALSRDVAEFRTKAATAIEPCDLYGKSGISKVKAGYEDFNFGELKQKALKWSESVSEKQAKFLAANFGLLAPAYQNFVNKEELAKGKASKLNFVLASDAICGIAARMRLKAYLPENDERWQKMDTAQAEKLADSFKGKITLAQQKFFASRGQKEEAMTMSFIEAKEAMENSKPTGKLKALVSRLCDAKDIVRMTCHTAKEIIKKNLEKINLSVPQPVSLPVYYHAVRQGRIKFGEKYTKGMWLDDCQKMPALPEQKAYIERYGLDFAVKAAESVGGKEALAIGSAALYAKVIKDHKRWVLENGQSPVQPKEKEFLASHNVDMANINTRNDARKAMLACACADRIVGMNVVRFLNTHKDIELPKAYLEAVRTNKTLSEAETVAMRKSVNEACINKAKADREYSIRTSTLSPCDTLYSVAKRAALKALEKGENLESCEETVAKELVCANFIVTDYMRTEVGKKLGQDKENISDANVYAHVITQVLPKGVGNYKACMKENSELVRRALSARDKEIEKDKIRKEASKEHGQTNSADRPSLWAGIGD